MGTGMRHACAARTVCEVLREIYDIHQSDCPTDILTRKLLHEAQDMAKRMNRKLKEYNKHYDEGWWEKNKDYEEDLNRRLAKNYLGDKP